MRAANKLVVRIYTARPGIIIGRKGAEIDKLKQSAEAHQARVHIDFQEVHRPELDAPARRGNRSRCNSKSACLRRAMRKARGLRAALGCKGIKVRVAGRLNGAGNRRKEWYLQGRLPLQTLREDIDFGFARPNHLRRIGVNAGVY